MKNPVLFFINNVKKVEELTTLRHQSFQNETTYEWKLKYTYIR